jgi:hypothetical protein
MDRYELGTKVVILEPFGDGQTLFEITSIQGVNANGEITESDAVYYQYEVNGVYYAHQYIKAV